jgi:hypothetical protein
MARKDQIQITASVGGVYIGEFREFTGGGLTSAKIKARNGASQIERARGGRQMVDDVTITRENDGTVDLKWLQSVRGKQSQGAMTVLWTPSDDDGNPMASRAITYTGILSEVNIGAADAQSETDLDDFALVMLCTSLVS